MLPATDRKRNPTDDRRLEIAPGLLDSIHRKQLGPAWHLYLYLLHRKAFRSAWVASGRPVPIGVLAWVEGTDESTIYRWLARLRTQRYIVTEVVNTGRKEGSGIRVRILKAKEWKAGKLRVFKDHLNSQDCEEAPSHK